MNRKFLAVACGIVIMVGLTAGIAQASSAVSVAIPFEFIVNAKTMPEGTYQIRYEASGAGVLVVKNVKTGQTVIVPVTTRLADLGGKEVSVVFDTADGTRYLSEVHIPGSDGFDLQGAPGKHTHTRVPGTEQQ